MSLLTSITSSYADIQVGIYSSPEKLIPLQPQSRIDSAAGVTDGPSVQG